MATSPSPERDELNDCEDDECEDYVDIRSLCDNGSSYVLTLPKSELRSHLEGNIDSTAVKLTIKNGELDIDIEII